MKNFIFVVAMITATPAFATKTLIETTNEEKITIAECEAINNRDKIELLLLRLEKLEQQIIEYEKLVADL